VALPPKLSFQYVQHVLTETLLEFLVRRFRYHDAPEWEKRIKDGHVRVNGKRAPGDRLLRTKDRIIYQPPPAPEPPVDFTYRVLYEDDHLLAVEKSGNIPTSPSGKYWHHCLVHHLMRDRGLEELHAVHRLDRETSGVNLFAKHRRAAGVLGKDFQMGRVVKEYLALLQGCFPHRITLISAPLRNNVGGLVHIRQEVHPEGRPAETSLRLLAYLPGASLVRISPRTGRTHQIRAHAAYLGHPIIGDKLYGRKESEFIEWVEHGERNSTERQYLHASRLEVSHPEDGANLDIRSSGEGMIQLLLQKDKAIQTSGG